MDPTTVSLPFAIAAAGWLLATPLLARAVRVAPWRRVTEGAAVHVWYGGIFCVIVLWSIRATIGDGFTFHLLGVTAFTLAVGPALALAGAAVIVAIEIAVRDGIWMNAGLAFVTMAAIPVTATMLTLRFAERRLPANFFVYVFVGAFFGAWLSYGAAALAGAAVLALGTELPAATRIRGLRAVLSLSRVRRGDAHRDGDHPRRRVSPEVGGDVRRRAISEGPLTAPANVHFFA